MRYFFHIAYYGAGFHGWQRQTDATSVQQTIEEALSRILKSTIQIVGCGRTDTGVHASQYFFHADISEKWNFDLLFRLNQVLPSGISLFEIIPVEEKNHTRYDAIRRTYNYFIHTRKDALLSGFSALYFYPDLDISGMKSAALLLTKYNDYAALCKSPKKHKSTICQVSSAELFTTAKGDRIQFQITSNRFLKGMIRIIIQKLLEVGRGKLSLQEFEQILINNLPVPNIKLAHPEGLYLSKISYPYLDVEPLSPFCDLLKKGMKNENEIKTW